MSPKIGLLYPWDLLNWSGVILWESEPLWPLFCNRVFIRSPGIYYVRGCFGPRDYYIVNRIEGVVSHSTSRQWVSWECC